jgi:hypothetical protein
VERACESPPLLAAAARRRWAAHEMLIFFCFFLSFCLCQWLRFVAHNVTQIQLLVLADGCGVATASGSRPGRKLLGLHLLLRRDHAYAADASVAAVAESDCGADSAGSGKLIVGVLIRTRFGE